MGKLPVKPGRRIFSGVERLSFVIRIIAFHRGLSDREHSNCCTHRKPSWGLSPLYRLCRHSRGIYSLAITGSNFTEIECSSWTALRSQNPHNFFTISSFFLYFWSLYLQALCIHDSPKTEGPACFPILSLFKRKYSCQSSPNSPSAHCGSSS